MTTLQLGLAIAGGLLLVCIILHGAWSARKHRPKQPTVEPTAKPTVEPEHKPPQPPQPTGQLAEQFTTSDRADRQRYEPSFDVTADQDSGLAALAALTTMVAEKKPSLNPLIDVIAPVLLDSSVRGEVALAVVPTTRRVGSKPFAVEGLNTRTRHWEFPVSGQRYSALQCGVQLANRMGALNQIEYSEFVIKTQTFADAIGGEPEFPEMFDEVARARELDQFASAHDAQLSFTVRAAQAAWSPGYIQQSASRCGFIISPTPGCMVLPALRSGAVVLTLLFDVQAAAAEHLEHTALREIKLVLDVPQVARSEQPFLRLCDSAIALAASMDGSVTDDNGNAIRADAMAVVGSELEQLYDTLDTRELAAGSALAWRLFS